MASSKDLQITSSVRPLMHRPSLSNASSGFAGRQSHARASSHSLLTSSLNANHRVTRRKSVTNPGANVAALAAALRDGERSPALPITSGSRRSTMSKSAAARAAIVGSLPSPPASLPLHAHKGMSDGKQEMADSAIEDDSNDMSADEGTDKTQKARVRRASDGQPLLKDGKKSNRVEVRCEKCGKGYKHSSCLTKHLWEHTPEWSLTSKLLISKHQQVQLLEAASVLVAMNGITRETSATPPDSTKDIPSDPESASPAASGYSDQGDRQSSADTTPPPMIEGFAFGRASYRKEAFGGGRGFPRSYQSASSLAVGSVPNFHGLGHSRQPSAEQRPTSSGLNNTGEDDRDLAAAVELLSCSFGSNNGSRSTVALPADAPPVPPVPARYLDQAASLTSTSFISSFPSRQPESFTRGELRRGSEDVKMEESGDSGLEDDDFDMRSRARSDEDDDGVFGRMEE
ncbi:hypothetical protein S40285_07841 [Stachybotrys chlorohalonatus IBT 40285]|uniref:C2H2-type domain-containing protein n=1 Tax=Stachybotrys chlorohalonatus (strain IBT 40285) TaxID=1283841 RepID=A0A084QFC9_STAC4|nr:hypothetical protein S40285_07841 [Stachybotrys chlorohalonata IBT 40285]